MSKFLKLFAPSLGGIAAVLGGAYMVADQFVVDIPAPARGNVVAAATAQDTTATAQDTTATAQDTTATAQDTTATASDGSSEAETAMPVAAMSGEKLGLGRAALPEEIAAWDLDVSPDGTGLIAGSGSVLDGEELFADRCAACHGDFAEGVDNWPKLAGGQDTLADKDPVKTVGSYWPYLSTAWDYVHRSMPFGAAQTNTPDEVYAMVAYILYSNDLVDEDFVLSDENFLDVEMPNANGFIVDDRETAEAHFWTTPCMENCKETVEITMEATVLDVTPQEEASAQSAPTTPAAPAAEAAEETAVAEVAATQDPAAAQTSAGPDPELVAAGEKLFKKCKACHQVGEGAKNRTGPELNDVYGRVAGSVEGFRYSNAMVAEGEGGLVWNDETLAAFLTKPKDLVKGTKMSFAGFKKESDLAAITAYLKSFAK